MRVTFTSPQFIRVLARQIPAQENRKGTKTPDHHFAPGDKAVLIELVDFAEYNGDEVTVTAIREDGPNGRAYYIKGRINQHLNWVYEYRLAKI